jgi:hypothetical protein
MRRHISPSMLVALIALAIALGGTAYAATQINGGQIKNGTITGEKLKNHTLTGTQLNLAKLGKVPSSAAADHATNASTLGGLAPSAFVQGGGQAFSLSTSLAYSTQGTLTLPELGAMNLACESNGGLIPTLANQTGATVQASIQTVDTGGTAISSGHSALPGATIFSAVENTAEQEHVLLAWGAHSADLTVGWYDENNSSQCVVLASGFVR